MTRHVLAAALTFAATLLNWYAWLGWDQRRDEHPDGHTTGPYEAWQVAGLVLVLLALALAAAWYGHAAAGLLGGTAGMAVAAAADWSDDASGLWLIGAGLVTFGTLLVGGIATGLTALLRNGRRQIAKNGTGHLPIR
ncbi:hypothetical protein [Spirillospora sp. NPDC029432]|uniref:hypothetical protein n=1 Tax=Spirillospora sp. NPDC029432 TaxID=3154599 RepID=UPI003455FF36